MQRRKYLAALGSLAAGGAAGIGTGAFTTVKADRGVTVDIVGDSQAYLALNPTGDRASTTPEGELNLDFASSDEGSNGLNPNGATQFHDVFSIKNQGDNDVVVGVGVNGNRIDQDDNLVLLEDLNGISGVGVFEAGPGTPMEASYNFELRKGADQPYLVSSGGQLPDRKLTPGDSISASFRFVTEGKASLDRTSLDPGIIIVAVEPGSERDVR
jgi:hypothetical protein